MWYYYLLSRAFMMEKSGKINRIASYDYSKDRIDSMHMSESIISSATYFYHLKTTDFY
jgi:polar amino acid transport system substrate-binding protein